MITFKKISQFQCIFTGDSASEKVLRDSLTFEIPNAQYSPLYQEGKWDGKVRLFQKSTNFIDIGLVDIVLRELESQNLNYRKIDFDKQFHPIDTSNLSPDLYQHQNEGVVKFFQDEIGIIQFPTRTGKTKFAAECIRLVLEQYPEAECMFVVDTEDLLHQSAADIAKHLKIPISEVGIIQGEKLILKRITVAMVQTLQSIFSKRVSKTKVQRQKLLIAYLRKVKYLLIDEIHDVVNTESRLNLFKRWFKNIYWLQGLSATSYKSGESEEDGLESLNNIKRMAFFGGISFEAKKEDMKERGIISKEKTLLLIFEHELSNQERQKLDSASIEARNKYAFYSDRLIYSNASRDQIILVVISLLRNLKFKTLGLMSSKKHGYKIEAMSGEKFLCGDSHVTEREEYKKKFLHGIGKILLASDIYKKGITLPEAEVLFNIDGGLEDSLIIQRKGRVLGVTENKKTSLTIDLIDNCENYFSEHGLNRIKVYEEHSGFENIDVIYINKLPNGSIDIVTFYSELRQYLEEYEKTEKKGA